MSSLHALYVSVVQCPGGSMSWWFNFSRGIAKILVYLMPPGGQRNHRPIHSPASWS